MNTREEFGIAHREVEADVRLYNDLISFIKKENHTVSNIRRITLI